MSGLSRTPGKRVWVHSPPRVRIPPFPPESNPKSLIGLGFFFFQHIQPTFESTFKLDALHGWTEQTLGKLSITTAISVETEPSQRLQSCVKSTLL